MNCPAGEERRGAFASIASSPNYRSIAAVPVVHETAAGAAATAISARLMVIAVAEVKRLGPTSRRERARLLFLCAQKPAPGTPHSIQCMLVSRLVQVRLHCMSRYEVSIYQIIGLRGINVGDYRTNLLSEF